MAKNLDMNNPLMSEPTEKKTRGRRRNPNILHRDEDGPSAQYGLTPEYTRFSVICKIENADLIRDYAYTKRVTIREAIDEIVEQFFKSYNKNPKNEPLLSHKRNKK